MTRELVFCKGCKYVIVKPGDSARCRRTVHMARDFYSEFPAYDYALHPNKENDCEFFGPRPIRLPWWRRLLTVLGG
jgi:hypothetical protein